MKIYEKPHTYTVVLRGPMLMLSGSNTVNDYNHGSDIRIGDEEE